MNVYNSNGSFFKKKTYNRSFIVLSQHTQEDFKLILWDNAAWL